MNEANAPLVAVVAEDEPSMLELVIQHLKAFESPRLEVIGASDGAQAWELAQTHLPDLVVLDVMMPEMSGWEVCKKIREDAALHHTSVVMLTGIGENLNQMTSPLYGADAYIDKPFDFQQLDEKVREALGSRAAQREAVPRPVRNGVGGPARAAVSSEGETKQKKAKPKDGERTRTKKKKRRPKVAAKERATKMAAKKSAKKGAKKAAKKGAVKKTAKKGAKKAAKKSAAKRGGAAKRPAKRGGAKKAAKRGSKRAAAPAASMSDSEE